MSVERPGPRFRPVHAIGLLFVSNGLSLPTLLPRFPEVKDAVGAGAATFGLALLGSGLGGIVGSALAPRLVRRYGTRATAIGSALLLAGAALLIAAAGSVPALFLAFGAMGLCDGVADTTQNHLLFDEQRRTPASLTSRMHALWSVGAVVGTGIGTLAAAQGVGVLPQTMVVSGMAVTAVLLAVRSLPRPSPATAPPAPAPAAGSVGRGRRLGRAWGPVAAAAMAVAAVEGIANEWSALTLRDGLGASAALAGAGPTAFAGAMLVGRLLGDRVIDRVGLESASRLSGALVAVGGGLGLLGAVLGGAPALLVAGLAGAGIGAAVLFPAMLAAGDRRDTSGTGVAVASGAARVGFLGVPVVMGTLAQAAGTTTAFWLLPLAGAVVAVTLPRALRGGLAGEATCSS